MCWANSIIWIDKLQISVVCKKRKIIITCNSLLSKVFATFWQIKYHANVQRITYLMTRNRCPLFVMSKTPSFAQYGTWRTCTSMTSMIDIMSTVSRPGTRFVAGRRSRATRNRWIQHAWATFAIQFFEASFVAWRTPAGVTRQRATM